MATTMAPPVDPVIDQAQRDLARAQARLDAAQRSAAQRAQRAAIPASLEKARRKEARRRRRAEFWMGVKAGAKGIWQAIKNMFSYGADKARQAGTWLIVNGKATALGAWEIVKSLGRGARYGVGVVGFYVSSAIHWIAKTVAFLAAGVAGTAIAGLDLAGAGVFWILHTVITYWWVFVIGTCLYLAGRTQTGYVDTLRERRRQADPLYVVPAEETASPAFSQQDAPGFPGFTTPGTYYFDEHGIHQLGEGTVDTPLKNAIKAWREANPDKPDMDFDFSEFIDENDLEEVLATLARDDVPKVRSYFTGRLRFCLERRQDPSILENDKAAWAKVNKGYEPQRREYPQQSMREGWNKMKDDFIKAKATA